MSDSNTVSQFIAITGADTTTANFFLSAADGNCDTAISTFFESGGHTTVAQDHISSDSPDANLAPDPAEPEVLQSLANSIFDRARANTSSTNQGSNSIPGLPSRSGNVESPTYASNIPGVIVRRNVTRTLTLYSNGFTVDQGPLRKFDDPSNEDFLRDINRGVVPREMEGPGADVRINLIDRKGEQYYPS